MATVTLRENGTVVGFGPAGRPPGSGGRRSVVAGWSEGSARRLLHRLFEVRAGDLPEHGLTGTFTFDRDLSSDEFQQIRAAWVNYLRQSASLVTWVVEWTARGRPHLHVALYDYKGDAAHLVLKWMDLLRRSGFRPRFKAQHAEEVWGAVGWLAYLAKHAGRGVAHYQRQGLPPGWTSTGRLWGFNGAWPRTEPRKANVPADFARSYRDALDAWMDARRTALALPQDPHTGVEIPREYRGVSVWIPLEDAMLLLEPLIRAAHSQTDRS